MDSSRSRFSLLAAAATSVDDTSFVGFQRLPEATDCVGVADPSSASEIGDEVLVAGGREGWSSERSGGSVVREVSAWSGSVLQELQALGVAAEE